MASTKSKTIIAIAALHNGRGHVSWNLLDPLGRARVRMEDSFRERRRGKSLTKRGGSVGVA